MVRKRLVWLLVLAMFFFSLGGAVVAASNDYVNHWATEQIDLWVRQGLLKGYDDGSFRPDSSITRAEFFAVINRIFAFQDAVSINFKDVAADAWYADVISKAVAAGYVSGYEDGTVRPNNPITRQEAAKVIAEAFKYKGVEHGKRFTDADKIGSWARNYINVITNKGVITGYPDGSFGPTRNLTRAETVVMLGRVAGDIYNEAGAFSKDAHGNVVVNTPGVTLEQMTIHGDLFLAEGIGEGEVVLDNVRVLGSTFVRGGGSGTIVLRNSELSNLVIQKKDGNVRVLATGNTKVSNATVETGGKLETQELSDSNAGFQTVTIPEEAAGDNRIVLEGNFSDVVIKAPGMVVEIAHGTNVGIIYVDVNTTVVMGEGANVQVIQVSSSVTNLILEGNGTVKTLITANKDIVKTADSVKVEKVVTKPEESSSGGSDSGGGTGGTGTGPGEEQKIQISAISVVDEDGNEIVGEVVVGETLTAKVTPEKATVTYKWMRADAEDGEYVAIAGATGKTYKLVADDAGKWIKVKATGTGNYTGTIESKPVGPVLAASLSWARIDDAEITPDAIGFSDQKLTIDDAVVNSPIYIAIKAENEADEALAARNVIIGEDVNTDSFGVEVVKGYVHSNGSWEKVEDPPKIEYDDSNQYFYYNLNNFEGTIVQVIKLTPKAVNTFTIKVYMVSM